MNTITLKCGTRISLSELEHARLSFVPCGYEQPLLRFKQHWSDRRLITRASYSKGWNAFTLSGMTGIQLMTGFPSYRRIGRTGYIYYNSIDIEYRTVEVYPDHVDRVCRVYYDNLEGSGCEILTKSGGIRLDAYSPYVGKNLRFKDEGGMLLEIFAFQGLSRLDDRYTMARGSVLDMPSLPKKAVQEIAEIASEIATSREGGGVPREVVGKSQLGNLKIEWGRNGRSQLFPTEHCPVTSHISNRNEVRFTKYPDGSVDGICFNCGSLWWEKPPRSKRGQNSFRTGVYGSLRSRLNKQRRKGF